MAESLASLQLTGCDQNEREVKETLKNELII